MMRMLFTVVSLVLAACSPIFSDDDCADKLMHEAISPDGKVVASLIQRDCGATTAYANVIYLKKASDVKGKEGNWGEKIYISQGEEISFDWRGSELRIKAATSGPNVFLKKDDWAGLKISYE